MLKLTLPAQVELGCPACEARFTLSRESLSERSELNCPLCMARFEVFDGLNGKLRRQVYYAIRGYLERRVYEQQQMNQESYFEDRGNIDH